MCPKGSTPIVLDTSVLLNFVKIDRIDLLGRLHTPVVILDQVLDEVRRPEQRKAVEDAVAADTLGIRSVRNPAEVSLFAELRTGGRLGAGECAVLAVALTRGWKAGLQDRRAQVEGRRRRKDLAFCQTEDVVLKLIQSRQLTVEEADSFLAEWAARHHFKSRLTSFRALIDK